MIDLAALWVDVARGYLRHAPPHWPALAELARRLNAEVGEHSRRRVVRTRFGVRFSVDTTDLIQRFLYIWGVWEPHMTAWVRRTLRPGDVYVDVGANIGYFSLLASHLVGSAGHVVAVEAAPSMHTQLLRHALYNGCDNIRAVNAAVSDADTTLTFTLASRRNVGAGGVTSYEGEAEERYEVQARALPDLLSAEEIARARIIKVDVEGAEGKVIRGLAPVLERLRADAEITVEVTPYRMAQLGDSVAELLRLMVDAGFHTYRLRNSYTPESYPAALHRPVPPVRWSGPVTEECDLVFSRTDAEAL